MSFLDAAIATALGLAVSSMTVAQTMPLAKDRAETQTEIHLTVKSTSIQQDTPMSAHFSAYGDGVSPQIKWSSMVGAKSYAVVVEDPDAKSPMPVVHWLVWNIPSTATELPEGMLPSTFVGLTQGKNSHGTTGYFGPHPPIGDPMHHYHFQVFALDQVLGVPAGADRDALLTAMKGHVVASGELVALFQQWAKVTQ